MSVNALRGCVIVVLFVLVSLVKKLRRRSLNHLPGPPSCSWLAGNLSDLQRPKNSMGDSEFTWIDLYGSAIKIKGPFGKDLLYLTDPKSLQYILNTSGYNFTRTRERSAVLLLLLGPGLAVVDGEHHARHRKVMNPAFSYSALKEFLPVFFSTAEKVSDKWRHLAQDAGSTSVVENVYDWLSRATLDAMGESTFDDPLNSLDNSDNELARVFHNLLADTLAKPTNTTIAAQAVMNYLPLWAHHIIRRIPVKAIKRLDHYLSTTRLAAQRILARELNAVQRGKPTGKDLMSLLIRANGNEDPKMRLSDNEIYAQLTTLMFAGHDTTSVSIIWALYEASKRPDVQKKIRDEVKVTRAAAASRGDTNLSMNDLESMKFTLATIKETLRFHPILPWFPCDYATSVPVSKGQEILISLCGYQRLKSVWGADADQWRPERFLEESNSGEKVGLGVVANLAVFSSGIRGCIGWRFAMLEIHAMLIELVENFEFSLPPDVEILRIYAGGMTPMVKGQTERGTQMPLIITPISSQA